MIRPVGFYRLLYHRERHLWIRVRFLHETEKAVLVYTGVKIWIPKLRIRGIRLRNNSFEVYVKESTIV